MILVIDIGNTNIKVGIFEKDNLIFKVRLSTIKEKTADQYKIEIEQLLKSNNNYDWNFDGSIISSVVPELTFILQKAVSMCINVKPIIVGPGIKTGMNIKIDNPAQLGSDLLVGAVAASRQYPSPCLIVDLGTASKISAIKDNNYLGCMISPGVKVSLNALSNTASQLSSIPLVAPSKAIGTNTITSMQSGIILGTASMIDGMIQRFREELNEEVSVVATGGLSNVVIEYCKEKIIHNDNLILEGLNYIYQKNNPV